MKSVCFINYEYPPIGAGAANACYHLAVSMANSGVKVSVLTAAFRDNSGAVWEDGVFVYRIPALRQRSKQSSLMGMLSFVISAVLHLPNFYRQSRPEAAIVFFSFPCGPIGLLIKLLWKVPYIVSLRGGDVPGAEKGLGFIHFLLSPLRFLIYKMSVAVVANSQGLRSLSLKSDRHTDVTIIPNGVDTEYFIPSPTIGNRSGEYTFLFAGRFQSQKNVAVLLDAYRIVVNRKINCKLVIIGDGPLKAELLSKSKSIGARDAVHWVSWCSKEDLRKYYQFVDCFVNPSIYEGMANTVLEAWACGLPVLAGDCIGNRDIVQDDVNGKLFNPESADDLADLLAYMVSHREIGILMGAAGRELCVQKFSWCASAKEYINVYDNSKE